MASSSRRSLLDAEFEGRHRTRDCSDAFSDFRRNRLRTKRNRRPLQNSVSARIGEVAQIGAWSPDSRSFHSSMYRSGVLAVAVEADHDAD